MDFRRMDFDILKINYGEVKYLCDIVRKKTPERHR